jgi:predicted GIY-YIG superfamily endonuclease
MKAVRRPIQVAPSRGVYVLYRLYNSEGVLLYVGITTAPEQRMVPHALEKSWWPEVAERTLTWYGSKPDASIAEDIAIYEEKPLYNITGQPSAARQELRETFEDMGCAWIPELGSWFRPRRSVPLEDDGFTRTH